MLIQKDQKKIRSVLENIYKLILPKKDINYFKDEIIQIIKNFNKKNPKKKIIISEKTSLIICYGDAVYSNEKSSIKVFQSFFQKNLKKYYQNASIFVLPSLYEGLGNVIIDAVNFEIPTIVTNCKSGPNEIILQNKGGYIVPISSPDSNFLSFNKLDKIFRLSPAEKVLLEE